MKWGGVKKLNEGRGYKSERMLGQHSVIYSLEKGVTMGRISWILFGWFALLPMAHAASFDCLKARTSVEHMICADVGLSKLDDDLSAAYKAALANREAAQRVKYDQKTWIEVRNDCQDASCLKLEYTTRLTILKQIVSGQKDLEGDTAFFGSWDGAGEATMSTIGYMYITATRLGWSGSKYSPACSTTYTVLERKKGQGHYPDEPQPYSEIPHTREFTSIRLRLSDAPCLNKAAYMLLVIRPSFPYHLDTVTYDSSGTVTGTDAFGRFPP